MLQKIANTIVFSCGKRALIIPPHVQDIFRINQQPQGSLERGGILLGYAYNDHDEITTVSTPNKLDKKGPFFFHRNKNAAQAKINTEWLNSSGSCIYLGEWHTHSQKNPTPSITDKTMIYGVLESTIMDLDYLYLIIVGLESTYWIGRQNHEDLTELEVWPKQFAPRLHAG
jgi:integrative and conjugative element protein (TIGR02256 family)